MLLIDQITTKLQDLGISTQLYLGHKLDYSNHQSAFVTSSRLL